MFTIVHRATRTVVWYTSDPAVISRYAVSRHYKIVFPA